MHIVSDCFFTSISNSSYTRHIIFYRRLKNIPGGVKDIQDISVFTESHFKWKICSIQLEYNFFPNTTNYQFIKMFRFLRSIIFLCTIILNWKITLEYCFVITLLWLIKMFYSKISKGSNFVNFSPEAESCGLVHYKKKKNNFVS